MKIPRETQRTAAQFLNGIAVAIIVAGVVAPFLAGGPQSGRRVTLAAVTALTVHLIALAVTAWRSR